MFNALDERMNKSLAALKSELATIRTGRANASLLDHVHVSYYGADTPLAQVATLSVPEPRMIMISPWDKTLISGIEKALLSSDLGLNPSNDGVVVRLVFPELTEDRRKELAKKVKSIGEKARVSIRNIRRDANDDVKKQLADGLPEDEGKRMQDKVQQITDGFIADVEKILEHKEQEIMTV